MRIVRILILLFVVITAVVLCVGVATMPSVKNADDNGFSAERVSAAIEAVSKKYHSVAHQQNREEVRDYLDSRLVGMGGVPQHYIYPSTKGKGYIFDAVDIVAEFNPILPQSDTAYVMLVAHYDSRYAQPFRNDTVWSYGAADDGYGIGIILECVNNLLKTRSEWKQGIKVLFTDAEEVGMVGMKLLWENNREVFDNVGLVVNIEARGPYGPAMLFEVSDNNRRLIELYSTSTTYENTYSITNLVYGFLPNFTDFTIVKDSLPGYNFSTVCDINHYHTHLDNYSNISLTSIQHYGEQILPLLKNYISDEKYSDTQYFKQSEEVIYFTIPVVGLIALSKITYLTVNIVIFIIALFLLLNELRKYTFKISAVLKTSAQMLLFTLLAFASGELVAYLSALISGVPFKFMGVVQGVCFDNTIMFVSVLLLVIFALLLYVKLNKKYGKNGRELILYSTIALTSVLSLILSLTIAENFFLLLPLAFVLFALLGYKILNMKLFVIMAIALNLLHAISFYYILTMALTIGAFGVTAMLAFINLMLYIPMADIYIFDKNK